MASRAASRATSSVVGFRQAISSSWMGIDVLKPEDVLVDKDGNNRAQVVPDLNVRTFAENAVLPQTGKVTIDVTVRDQNLIPVAGADITETVKLPSGEEQRIIFDKSTDENGIGKYTIDFKDQPIGLAEIRVKASYRDLQKIALTSFRIWR
jgi:hypothetical protein